MAASNVKFSQLCFAILALVVSSQVSAAESCGVNLTLMQSSFEAGEQPINAELPPDGAPLTLAVTYPPDGITVGAPSIQAYGTVTGPPNLGVSINEKAVAIRNASHFTTQLIPLTAGANLLSIVATTQDGATQTIVRNVTYDPGLGEDVRFVGKTAGDFSPVRIGFDLTTRFPAGQNQIARTQIDFNGDGTFDVDTVSPPATIESDYAVAGVYLARARVTFDDGSMVTVPVEREATFRIQTHLLAYTREVVCKLYYDMKHRLQANNIMSALNTVAASKRAGFQSIWNSLGANLPTVAGELGDLVQGQLSSASAELVMAMPKPGMPGSFIGYPVLFARDATGVWRVIAL